LRGRGSAANSFWISTSGTDHGRGLFAVLRGSIGEPPNAKTMAAILADDFVLVEGNGKRSTKADLLNSATDGKTHYEHQEDTEQTVMVSGDTAVITAKLWAKGLEDGTKVDYTLWLSDVYVRTPKGWRYFFGQASLPLTRASKH